MTIGRFLVNLWDRFWFEPGPASRLGLARMAFCGSAFVFYLPQDFSEWATAAPAFWMPIPVFEMLHLRVMPMEDLVVLQAIWKVALALSAVGLYTRIATIVSATLGGYLLGLPHNFGATQHFDAIVVFALCILAVSRSGDARSLDAWRRRLHDGAEPPSFGAEYTWPIRAMWTMTALIFFAAGTSKLRHSGLEWAFSDNLRLLLIRGYYHVSDSDPLTSWGLVVANHSWPARTLAMLTLLIETGYLLCLFSRRFRPIAGVCGVFMLIGIRVLMGPTFESFLMCGLVFVPWHRIELAITQRMGEGAMVPSRWLSTRSLIAGTVRTASVGAPGWRPSLPHRSRGGSLRSAADPRCEPIRADTRLRRPT